MTSTAEHALPWETQLHDRLVSRKSKETRNPEDQFQDPDAKVLALLGKRQRLRRYFGRVSLVAFSTTLLASWESIACLLQDGLINGGSASLIYGLIFSFLGSLATCASLAEMSSMLPTSGGQYHWVAELAPSRFAVFLSYLTGWITTFARMAVSSSAAYVAATEIQGLLILNLETYVLENWHVTFLYWGVFLSAVVVNVLGIRFFPHIETLAFMHHICFFFIFLIPLVYLSPQSTPSFVFANFENSSGWESNGVSWGIGLLASAWAFVGIDGTSHMSEEVENSAIVVPQSMLIAFFISGASALGISIAILFSIGDVYSVLSSATGFPIIEIFHVATGSKKATTAIIVGLMMTSVFSTFGLLASSSRLTWAFACDNGFPYAKYLQHVDRHYLIPVRAIFTVTIVGLCLGLINLWSSTALNAMTSLSLIGHYTSYLLPISLMALKRIRKEHIPYGPFRLGHWGLPINLISVGYSIILLAFMVLPPYKPVTASSMNYAGVVFGAVIILSLVLWYFHSRMIFKGPVREVIEGISLS